MYIRHTLCVAAITLLLAGCTNAPVRKVVGTAHAPPDAGAGSKSIRVMLNMSSRTELALRDAFVAEHPEYQVSLATIPFDPTRPRDEAVKEKLEEARAGKIDVVSTLVLENTPQDELLLRLDPLISQKRFDLKPLERLVDLRRTGGMIYALPVKASPHVLAYNADLFEAAGVPLPRSGWTWDDLREAAVKLTRGSGAEQVWGLSSPQAHLLVYEYLQDRAPGALSQDEAVLREALAFVTGLAHQDQVMPPDQRRESAELPLFARGQAAMTYDAYGLVAIYMPDGARWGILPLPGRARPVQAQMTHGLGISAKSPNQEAAWTFLSWLAGPEGAKVLAGLGEVPAYTGSEAQQAWAERKPAPPPGSHIFFTEGLAPYASSGLQQQDQRFWTMVHDSLAGTRPWEDALAEYLKQDR